MRIALIAGKEPSRFDKTLLKDIEFIQLPPEGAPNESYLIGIRDEHGDVYRSIDIAGTANFAYLATKLRELGYREQPANSYEAELGFDMMISVPKLSEM